MKCIHCQKELPDGAKFCKYCGQKQEAVQPTPKTTQQNISQSTPEKEPISVSESKEQPVPVEKIQKQPEKVSSEPVQTVSHNPTRQTNPPVANVATVSPEEDVSPAQAKKSSIVPIVWRLAVIVVEAGILAYLCIRFF